jgi:hypothetical protein
MKHLTRFSPAIWHPSCTVNTGTTHNATDTPEKSALFALLAVSVPLAAAPKKTRAQREFPAGASIWAEPTDIASRDLYYGPGGKQDEPRGRFTFEKEDPDGTNPKFVVRDQDGVKWKVKLGEEARPETAASRLVWGVGYYADEDYFLQDLSTPVQKFANVFFR